MSTPRLTRRERKQEIWEFGELHGGSFPKTGRHFRCEATRKVTVTYMYKKTAVLQWDKLKIIMILKFVNDLYFCINYRDCKFIF